MSHADDASAWPRFGQHERRFQSKAVVTELNGERVGGLSDLMAIACAVQATADAGAVPGSVVARDVQDDDAPGGRGVCDDPWLRGPPARGPLKNS